MNSNVEYIPSAGPGEPTFTSNGGSIFTNAQRFTVAGGTFTTNNYVLPLTVPPDFRMLPWGDIDLQRELLVNKESGAIGYLRKHNYIRRVYSAKVEGRSSNVTVAVYRGEGAEKDWRQDIETSLSMRHPNIIQIWAGASYGNIHATVFHGDLVPIKQYMNRFPPIVTVYLYAHFSNEWNQTQYNYFRSELQWDHLRSYDCTLWIRSSTGRLLADLVPPDRDDQVFLDDRITAEPRESTPVDPSHSEAIAIQSLSLREYLTICHVDLSQIRSKVISTSASVTLGGVIYWPMLDDQGVVEIASLLELHLHPLDWLHFPRPGNFRVAMGNLMENGWMRFNSSDLFDTPITLFVISTMIIPDDGAWLTQANYIFNSLHIGSNLENYTLVDEVSFKVIVPNPTVDCPHGCLFLCPQKHFRVGVSSFKWPDSPAYWSLDPAGVERLSMEEATQLGFPRFELATEIKGRSWDTSVYAGLRQFHRAKGFDPESQDVARHLGHPLFHLLTEVNPHVGKYDEEGEDWADDEGDDDWVTDEESFDWRDHCETDGTSVDERDDTEAEWTDEEEAQSTSGAEGPDHYELTPEGGDEEHPDRHDSEPDGASVNERGNTQTEWCGKQEQPASVTGGEVHCNPAPKKHQRPSDADIEMRGPSPATEGNPGVSQLQYLEDTTSQPMLHSTDEDIPISTTFEILMNIQLALILFLATCWVYDNLQ